MPRRTGRWNTIERSAAMWFIRLIHQFVVHAMLNQRQFPQCLFVGRRLDSTTRMKWWTVRRTSTTARWAMMAADWTAATWNGWFAVHCGGRVMRRAIMWSTGGQQGFWGWRTRTTVTWTRRTRVRSGTEKWIFLHQLRKSVLTMKFATTKRKLNNIHI